jgi:hypothetical protein
MELKANWCVSKKEGVAEIKGGAGKAGREGKKKPLSKGEKGYQVNIKRSRARTGGARARFSAKAGRKAGEKGEK